MYRVKSPEINKAPLLLLPIGHHSTGRLVAIVQYVATLSTVLLTIINNHLTLVCDRGLVARSPIQVEILSLLAIFYFRSNPIELCENSNSYQRKIDRKLCRFGCADVRRVNTLLANCHLQRLLVVRMSDSSFWSRGE
jgi:hypothetical protein